MEALKAALADNKSAEFKVYLGAPHGFHADYRLSYRKDAAEDAWSQMQAWFKKYNVLSCRSPHGRGISSRANIAFRGS